MPEGELSLTFPALRLQEVTHPMAHLTAARDFVAGLQAIAASGQSPHRAVALLAGQAVESLLQGYVLASLSPNEPPRDGGHDLEVLWAAAASRGLPVPQSPPQWLKTLAHGHRPPFSVRYQRAPDRTIKAFVHGNSYAPFAELMSEIPKLEALVSLRIEEPQRARD